MNDQTNKPEYSEPWTTGTTVSQIIDDRNLTIADCLWPNGETGVAEDRRRAARIVKLVNLFAGVSDEQLDNLTNRSNGNIFGLIRAILLNPLESVPLAMLIDELQDTPEYQAQTGCYKTWHDLYCKLLNVAEQLSKQYENENAIGEFKAKYGTGMYILSQDIRTFLAPISYMTQSRYVKLEPRDEPT